MEHFKVYSLQIIALGFTISEINPIMQTISLLLACVYTVIQITKTIK